MRSITTLLGTVLVLSLASAQANACMCEGPPSPCASYGKADAVFVGTVISVGESKSFKSNYLGAVDWYPVAYKFSVEQSYSGVSGTRVEVLTGPVGIDCGYPFEAGQRYLVYAYRDDKDKLSTSVCTRTKLFASAREDLAFLGTLSSRPSGVTFSAELRHASAQGKFVASEASITIETDTQRREVRPDADGDLSVSGLSPGQIKVSLKLPDKFTTRNPEETFTVPDRGCVMHRWYVHDNTRISGRVVNTEGLPVTGIQVTLEDPADVSLDRTMVNFEPTDEEGRFLFAEVPPGRYLLSVNRSRHPSPSNPNNAYAPTYYPGVTDDTDARVIVVEPGDNLNDLEVRVTKRPISIVEVSLVWPDGSPVKNAYLYLQENTDVDTLWVGERPDEQGRFKFNGFVGQKLVIRATDRHLDPPSSEIAKPEATGQVTITLKSVTEPVRIVMRKPDKPQR